LAVVYHIFVDRENWLDMVLVPVAFVSTLFHVYLYDFYKESYMMMTRPDWNGRIETLAEVQARLARLKAEGSAWMFIASTAMYVGLIRAQTKVVSATNPSALRESKTFPTGSRAAETYRRHNRGTMRLWTWVSLAPHSYLLSICCMLDQLHVYLWGRVILANAVFLIAFFGQRRATTRTLQDWQALAGETAP
jgi:hypothetical protein